MTGRRFSLIIYVNLRLGDFLIGILDLSTMCEPQVKYLVSSPDGDIIMDEARWQKPLLYNPDFTYGHYLEALKAFISRGGYKPFIEAVSERLKNTISLSDIDEILIRTEKHGALYHLASIEVTVKGQSKKFAVNVAISRRGKDWLNHEFFVLKQLNNKFDYSYLPNVYFLGEVKSMLMFLAEWFEGYYEFHISKDKHGRQKTVLWDFDHGYKSLSNEQTKEIYKQASNILTIYYDTCEFKQIFPWHHAAGDFVVKIDNGSIDVKLTTARKYQSVIVFLEEGIINPLMALIYFFLNLSIRMRLDRFDGIGDVAWANDFCVDGVVEGFFEALRAKERTGKYNIGTIKEFISLLKHFGKDDLELMLNSLMDIYKNSPEIDTITGNLKKHADKLYSVIQTLPL